MNYSRTIMETYPDGMLKAYFHIPRGQSSPEFTVSRSETGQYELHEMKDGKPSSTPLEPGEAYRLMGTRIQGAIQVFNGQEDNGAGLTTTMLFTVAATARADKVDLNKQGFGAYTELLGNMNRAMDNPLFAEVTNAVLKMPHTQLGEQYLDTKKEDALVQIVWDDKIDPAETGQLKVMQAAIKEQNGKGGRQH